MATLPAARRTVPGGARRSLIGAGLVLIGVVVVIGAFTLSRAERAARAAVQGKRALLQAEKDLGAHQVAATRRDLDLASSAFARADHEIRSLGPVRAVAHRIPLVRVQLQSAEAYAAAGDRLTTGARNVTDAAAEVLNPRDQHLPLSEAVDALRRIRVTLDQGIDAMNAANARVATLNGKRLIGPLDSARRQLAEELPAAQRRARAADEGLAALIDFAGGNGPRRYLVFSQNPDEPRPTGGFIGTYGVISAASGHVSLERYASIESWYPFHPDTAVPADQAPSPFKLADVHQTFANVNAIADWPTAARLAMTMWQRGGEVPVDGVIAVTPEFLGRILGVLGPVVLPGYGETITSSNVVERVEYHTHVEAAAPGTDRKGFIVDLASAVMQKLLDAPAAAWDPLGRAVSAAFDGREAMAWSNDDAVSTTLADRRWDGTLPATAGDFFYDGEFAYATKNGRGLHRTFNHVVTLEPNGSARVTTTVTVTDTEPPNAVNGDSLSYLTFYGPTGASLVKSSLPPDVSESSLSDHPAAGWDLAALPLRTTSLTFTWSVPHLLVRASDGTWRFQLWWMRVPDHDSDTLQLRLNIPPGWHWQGASPPTTLSLSRDVVASWVLAPAPG
jgi:hypothetical protein